MNNYTTNSEYQINHATQQACQTKPATRNEPTIRKHDDRQIVIYKEPEYQVVEKDHLENKVARLEKQIKTLEDRLNYHIHLLDGLAHSI